jgi:hypothetical protein
MAVFKIVIAVLMVAAFQVFGHWYLSKPYGLSQFLLKCYLTHDPKVGKGVSGWVDLFLPCVCLGFFIGWVCWYWSVLRVVFIVTFTGVGMVILLPIYKYILHDQPVWWWPQAGTDLPVFFVKSLIKATVLVAFFAYFGRRFGVHFKAAQYDARTRDAKHSTLGANEK